jgi:hypothetical protein
MSDDPAPKASIPDSDAAKLGARLLRFLPFITIAHFLVALPTLIISLALAYFAFVQADATRKMQTGGAMPFVTFGTSNFNDKTNVQEISLSLSNNGIGPAILGPIEVRYEGRPMANAEQLLGTCCGGGRTSFSTSPASGIALRPGESASFLRLTRSPQNEKDLVDLQRRAVEAPGAILLLLDLRRLLGRRRHANAQTGQDLPGELDALWRNDDDQADELRVRAWRARASHRHRPAPSPDNRYRARAPRPCAPSRDRPTRGSRVRPANRETASG